MEPSLACDKLRPNGYGGLLACDWLWPNGYGVFAGLAFDEFRPNGHGAFTGLQLDLAERLLGLHRPAIGSS